MVTAATRLRFQIERRSQPILRFIVALPRAIPFLVTLSLLISALVLPRPWSALGPALAAIVISWLLYLSWQQTARFERLGKIAVLLLVIAVCLVQLLNPDGASVDRN
jgi:hypothetical protein